MYVKNCLNNFFLGGRLSGWPQDVVVASQSVDVAQLKDALSKLRTNPSKLTMLMQQVKRFENYNFSIYQWALLY